MNNKIYCLGETISDLIFKTEEAKVINEKEKLLCFEYGEKIAVQEFIQAFGGSAFNVSVGLQKMNFDPKIISSIGSDSRGKEIMQEVEKMGMDSSFLVESKESATKTSAILISPDGDRTILVYHGKNSLSENVIDWDKIEENSWFFLGPLPDGTQELIDKVVDVVQSKKIKLIVNPGVEQVKWGREGSSKIIAASEIYILNMNEASDMLNIDEEKQALEEIIKLGAKQVIITKGEEGVIAKAKYSSHSLSAFKAKMIDSTGAGDSFNVGVIGALMNGRSFDEALLWGAINGASTVEKFGAQAGFLTIEEIEEKIKENSDYKPKIM